jgi:hypothetical protein
LDSADLVLVHVVRCPASELHDLVQAAVTDSNDDDKETDKI